MPKAKEYGERIIIRLPSDLAKAAKKKAKAQRRTLSEIVREMLHALVRQP
jgi:predicted HicB family RNase H-like nuclease